MKNDELLKETMNVLNNLGFEEIKKTQDLAKKTMEAISSPALEEMKKFQELTSSPIFKEIEKMQELSNKTIGATNSTGLEDMKRFQELTSSPVMKIIEDMENMSKLSSVQPQLPPLITMPVDQNLASEFHTRLINWIHDFDSELDHEHEVGVRLVSFGQTVNFHLKDIDHWNPSLISFSGNMENGDPVELIQHVSQISILLIKMKREDPTLPKRPIGFSEWGDEHPEGM